MWRKGSWITIFAIETSWGNPWKSSSSVALSIPMAKPLLLGDNHGHIRLKWRTDEGRGWKLGFIPFLLFSPLISHPISHIPHLTSHISHPTSPICSSKCLKCLKCSKMPKIHWNLQSQISNLQSSSSLCSMPYLSWACRRMLYASPPFRASQRGVGVSGVCKCWRK